MKYWSNYPSDKHLLESYEALVEEKKILAFWTKKRTFDKIQENRRKENDGTFSIHCGPTFPSGSPHTGHILNGIVKDIFMRYGFQKKLQVVNQFGWDCHGIPVEYEVDKKLGIKTPGDVQKMGIATYNEECRRFVQRHQAEWNTVFERMGNWVDFSKAYSTMSAEYMESVWRVFKELYEKGLVYKDTKVMPYSTSCFTHLSDFEADQNWKEVTEVGAIISLNIVNSSVKLLIWTTAPWTLVANLAVCVNTSSMYVKVKLVADGNEYIVSMNRLAFVFRNPSDYVVLAEINGKQLENLQYQPLFSHFSENWKTFSVIANECIRDDLGTGIVAISPYFVEDDYRICLENGVNFDEALCPIDDSGHFKEEILEVAGLGTHEANDVIIETLKQFGHLIHLEDIKHKKAHCWRSDVPLINKATSTWFIKIESLSVEKDTKVESHYCNRTETTKQYKDWAVGRTRYWGTPLPIWVSPNGDEIRCIGSIDELLQLTGVTSISDLHREFVDELVIPSSIPGNPPLRRVPEVFDCWFESGVMPYIQQRVQADLIVEGLDQSCGWFHTTSILSAALNQFSPSENIMSHGLVLGSDGMKVSKRKHNNSNPLRLADMYGADSLRLYLVTSPLAMGENFTPQKDGVREMAENVIKPLNNILSDLVPRFCKKGTTYGITTHENYITNIFDKWMLSCAESLLQFYDTEMKSYRLHTIIPRIIKLIKQVEDWYLPIRYAQCAEGHREYNPSIVYNVVYKICLMLAPFAPFFIEHIYQILQPFVGVYFRRDFFNDSVLTRRCCKLVLPQVELNVMRWQKVIELVREVRTKLIIPIQYRISELIVVHPVESYLKENAMLNETMMKMTNAHQIRRTNDRGAFGGKLTASLKTNTLLHKRLSSTELEDIVFKVNQLSDGEVNEVIENGSLEFKHYKVSLDDIQVSYQFNKSLDRNLAITSKDDVLVVIRMNKDVEYYGEGTRLELISSVQKLKRKAKIYLNEPVTVCYATNDSCLQNAFQKYSADVGKCTNSSIVKWLEPAVARGQVVVQDVAEVKGVPLTLYLFKND